MQKQKPKTGKGKAKGNELSAEFLRLNIRLTKAERAKKKQLGLTWKEVIQAGLKNAEEIKAKVDEYITEAKMLEKRITALEKAVETKKAES
jgi:hypothetical protein